MIQKIDINSASVGELTQLPGIGKELAQRMIAYREKVGRFRTVEELAAVSGISERMVERLKGRLSTNPPKGSGETDGETRVEVFLSGGGKDNYRGHRLTADFTRRDTTTKDDFFIAAQISTELPPDGDVTLTFPARNDMRGEVTFRVHAPDGEILHTKTFEAAKLPEKIEMRVKPKQFASVQPNTDPAFGKPKRLRGQVIDRAGKTNIARRQVVIWGATVQNPQTADFRALVVMETDGRGYFSGVYPLGEFTAAFGDVSVKDDAQSVPIHLQEDGTFPESVILVVDVDECDCGEDECRCGADPNDVPRDPDSVDLARGDGVFSSDPGAGKCVDFTKPDRTLEEFSYTYVVRTTEPDIKGLTLEEPEKIDIGSLVGLFPAGRINFATADVSETGRENLVAARESSGQQVAGVQQIQKTSAQMVDARALRTLARDPDRFSLTNVTAAAKLTLHGDLLRLLGKHLKIKPGRGRMTCNNPVDWDDEPTIYQACTIAHGHVLRFKQEWVADGYSMGTLLNSLPLAPGQKKQIAVVDWERREENVRREAAISTEALESELSRDRDINEVVRGALRESVRGGSSSSSSSFGGGLGIGAAGIIGSFGVGGLLGIGGGTSSASSSAFQNSSRNTSASALNQLRDRTIQSASAVRSQRSSVVQSVRQGERVTATTETVANYNHCHAITIQYFEVLRHLLVRQRLVDVQECLFVPLLMSRFTRDKVLRWRNTLYPTVRNRRLRKGFDALERIENNYEGSDLPVGTYADQSLDYLDGDLTIRFELARPRDDGDDFNASAWTFLGRILPFINPQEFYEQHLRNQRFKDRVFLQQLGPQIAERFVQYIGVEAVLNDNSVVDLPIDATLLGRFANNRPLHVSLRLAEDLPPLRRTDIKYIRFTGQINIAGIFLIDLLPANSKVIIEGGNMRYRTKYSSGYLFRSGRIQDDIVGSDDVMVFTPLSRQELRNPREEDKELARNLMDHLNENIERYHHAIWWRMSPDRRYMLLDGFTAPNSDGRSVASVVENELIGIAGNSLILPVARGFHLDPTFNQDVENPVDLLEHYEPNTPLDPTRIALPTRGVYAEAVMGACNSCEFKEEERFWRWEESPIPDQPPAILPVSTDSRRADTPDLTAKDFPSPIINLQNAPAAPDPTGLSGALQLLGTPNLFKDITGLEGTQKNAAAALEGALNTAQFFGGKAADLALQARMGKDIDKAMRTIQKAKESGLISDQQAEELTNNAISGMIGGGSNADTKPISTKEVKDIVDKAGQNEAAVSVSRPGGDKVEVDARPDAAAQDNGRRTIIVFPEATNSPENRAFNPSTHDTTGVIDIEATVRNAPDGASLRWSAPDPTTITIDTPHSNRTRVRGLKPGKTAIDVGVFDSTGNRLASQKVQLSVPQFVLVNEDAAAFDGVLQAIHLDTVKDAVVAKANEVCKFLLRTANVRTVWQIGGLNEALPAHLPAGHVTTATFRGEPPAGRPNLLGRTNSVGGTGGASVFNETIDIFPGAYDNPIAGGSDIDTDIETQALIVQLESQTFTDPALEQFAIEVYGRLLGETLAHEIVHSLLWQEIDPSFHNTPPVANDLMNPGSVRTFRQRTGFEDTAHTSPVEPDNFIDHGLAGIGGLQATNQALVNNHFPVPPAFA